MPATFTESTVEEAALEIFEGMAYKIIHGPTIAPGEMFTERSSYGDVILIKRLREALARINSHIPTDAIEDGLRRVLRTESPSLVDNNRRFHRFVTDGVPVEYRRDDRIVHDTVRLIDFVTAENNDWIATNQFTIEENRRNRRPDIIVFINGLPLAVVELKNLADENATIRDAYNQLQTYKNDIPSLFPYNELLLISDGIEARLGTLTSGWERFMPWRTIEGDKIAAKGSLEMEVLLRGVFDKKRFLDLVRNFIVFEQNGPAIEKKVAGYHQFHAVNKAVERTLDAVSAEGDRRAGVVWHTQGSGKSLTMAFYAGKVIQHPAMSNPTLVVLTDRNDLDDQLFGTFSACKDLLRQTPEHAQSRDDLQELLRRSAGGVIFTTIQKFLFENGTEYPQLSDRRNIVVMADEAHRSQYGFIEGFARHMRNALPNASFIGFTATPIESDDRSTPVVFGDYIDIYDIQRAVEDGATVRIYYEGRLAKLELDDDERPKIDPEFEEVTEGEEDNVKRNLMSKWSRMESMVGTPKRIGLIADDIVEHFAKRLEAMDGKAMIVCMSRRICVDLYNALIKLRREWHHEDDDKGSLKVVMTGSASDPVDWQGHIRGGKARRELLANRFKDPNDVLKIAIVRDMWLTGFDVPCLHTMYVDKPMQRHGLMQAIARVNRVFKDKPGGLIVDYLGLATQLQKAVTDYTDGGGKGEPVEMQEKAVAKMVELYEVCAGIMHGFDYSRYRSGSPKERTAVIPAAAEHVLQQEDGKNRFMSGVSKLSKAFALSVPHEKAIAVRDDVGFFQAVRAGLAKSTPDGGKSQEDLDTAVRQIVSKAVASDEMIDIFSAAGLKRPDISILSDQFLAEVKDLPHKNLAIETLRKLLTDEIKGRARKNLVQSRQFSEMLEEAIRKYQNRSLQAAQVIQELIDLAKDMRQAHERGEKLGLSDEELAFYDALETNDSAVQVLGDETLKKIALELLDTVRKNTTIDWTVKESVRAKLRVMVKRILRKYGYPPDKQEQATHTVLQQAELLSKDWVS